MTFEEILAQKKFRIPLKRKSTEDFLDFIKDILNSYKEDICKSDNLSDEGLDDKEIKWRISNLVDSIIVALKYYLLDGKPSKAYDCFQQGMKSSNAKNYLEKTEAPSNQGISYYRIRETSGSTSIDKLGMFHLPFELRHRSSSQRFSISGYPSLYLSSRTYVAWEELGRPDKNDFLTVRLEPTRNLKLLDITSNHLASQDFAPKNPNVASSGKWDSLYAAIQWPIMAACSVKVLHRKASFMPEYIIPQFLLEWVREIDDVDGIKFSSSHIDFNSENVVGDYYNVVIPVKSIKKRGHCPDLLNAFKVTLPISLSTLDMSTGGQLITYNREESTFLNRPPEKFEMTPGFNVAYSFSQFHKLELALRRFKAEKI